MRGGQASETVKGIGDGCNGVRDGNVMCFYGGGSVFFPDVDNKMSIKDTVVVYFRVTPRSMGFLIGRMQEVYMKKKSYTTFSPTISGGKSDKSRNRTCRERTRSARGRRTRKTDMRLSESL